MGISDKLRGTAKNDASPKSRATLAPQQADELIAAFKEAEAAEEAVLDANLELRDHAMRAVARTRRETVLVDRPKRTDACFGLVAVAEDGQTLWVYEGQIVERDGSIEPVGAESLTVPGVAVMERGSAGYFNELWRADDDLWAQLDARPDVMEGLADGTIDVRYVLISAHAEGRITTTDYTLQPGQLKLGL